MSKINEGYYDDIKDTVKDVAAQIRLILGKNDKRENYLNGSISQYTNNLIMTFPVLCDNTISPETASMISKANERNITTMLQLLFTAMNIEANDGMKVLAQVHKNISTSMDVYQVMDKMNDIGDRMRTIGGYIETAKGDYDKYSQCITEMNNELKYNKFKSFPVNSLSENSLNRISIQKMDNRMIIKEASKLTPAEIQQIAIDVQRNISTMYNNINGKQDDMAVYTYLNGPDFNADLDNIIKMIRPTVEPTDEEKAKIRDELIKRLKNDADLDLAKLQAFAIRRDNVVKLVDTDVKKANELQPTVLQINYSEKKDNGDVELRTFLAGVKSRLVAVDSTDIIERIIAKNKTKINFLNFIRATTGEIRFFKDFLLAVDQAKLDSKNAVKKGEAAAIWNCLANRATKNTNNRLRRLGNDASAITMLVVSQETVNYMKSVHKFDLEKMNNTKMVCEAYNLMGIIIVDESIEVVKVFYVGNNNYERIPFSFMEKENNNSDYKKMVSLMGKMNTR